MLFAQYTLVAICDVNCCYHSVELFDIIFCIVAIMH